MTEKDIMVNLIKQELVSLSTWLVSCKHDHRDLRKIYEQKDSLNANSMLYLLKQWYDNKNFNDEEDSIADYIKDKVIKDD